MLKNWKQKINFNSLPWVLLAVILLGAGGFAAFQLQKNRQNTVSSASEQKDVYLAFSNEIYDVIQQNYWNKITDKQLTELYRLATAKINTSSPATLTSEDKPGLDKLITDGLKNKTAAEKKDFVTALADMALANLPPLGRSRLYNQQLVQNLNNEVNNVDTSTNLYSDLGVPKNSSQEQIDQTYQQKTKSLEQQNTPEAKQQLALINRAHEALKTSQRRQQYDQTGIEPAVTFSSKGNDIYYIKVSRFSPTLLQELKEAASGTPISAANLILDLRGNIGGAIDQLPNVLSDFLGPNAAAIQFYHLGGYLPYATTGSALPQLEKFKNKIILVDNQTQSSAEVMAGVLKKFNFGIVVGAPTRGWGSIERIFDLQNQLDPTQHYSVFLVHTLTIADDNQPIEGRGIAPTIDTRNKNWEQEFLTKVSNSGLLRQVKLLLNQ